MLYPAELWLQGCRLIAHQFKNQNAALWLKLGFQRDVAEGAGFEPAVHG